MTTLLARVEIIEHDIGVLQDGMLQLMRAMSALTLAVNDLVSSGAEPEPRVDLKRQVN